MYWPLLFFQKCKNIPLPPPYNTVRNMVIQLPTSSYANVKSEVLIVMTMKGYHLLVCTFIRCDNEFFYQLLQ